MMLQRIRQAYWLPVDEDEWLDANRLGKLRLHGRCVGGAISWYGWRRRRNAS